MHHHLLHKIVCLLSQAHPLPFSLPKVSVHLALSNWFWLDLLFCLLGTEVCQILEHNGLFSFNKMIRPSHTELLLLPQIQQFLNAISIQSALDLEQFLIKLEDLFFQGIFSIDNSMQFGFVHFHDSFVEE
jgi:hypothetical protein